MSKLHLGLVGYGIWGQRILENLVSMSVPVTVCDTDPARRRLSLKAGADAFVEQLESMPKVHGYIIATPASTHAAIISRLDDLGNQAALFVEKPLTDSASEAQLLTHRSGPPVYVMHIWTYHAGIRKLKELLESGVIGAPTLLRSTRANWTSPRSDVDSLGNLAPHDLSIFHFLLGHLPHPSNASAEFVNGALVGCVACLQDDDGPPCILEVSNRYSEKRREVRVHGEYGVLVLPDDTTGAINLIRGGGFIVPERTEAISYSGPSALETELRAFLAYLNGDQGASLWDIQVGVDVVRAIDEIRTLACRRHDIAHSGEIQ